MTSSRAAAAAPPPDVAVKIQSRALAVATAFRRSAATLTGAVALVPFEPAHSVLSGLVGVLSLLAETVCDMAANRETAAVLGATCEATADALFELLHHGDAAVEAELRRNPALTQLKELLDDVRRYLDKTFVPPPDAPLKKWVESAKAAATVKSVKEQLTDYTDRLKLLWDALLVALAKSTRLAVADLQQAIPRYLDELRVGLRADLQDELRRFMGMPLRMRQSMNFGETSDSRIASIVDYRVDKVEDLFIEARYHFDLIQKQIMLDNIPDDAELQEKIRAIVQDMSKHATKFAADLRRKQNILDWMVPASSVTFSSAKENRLGVGGFSDVYKGEFAGQKVAVKLFRSSSPFSSREIEKAIATEIDMWRRVSDHQYILTLFGVSTKTDQTAEALKFVHSKGIIHRDVKGRNILIRADGSTAVGDFGLSRCVGSISTTSGCELAKEIGANAYVECSAATFEGVNDVFEQATRAAMQAKKSTPKQPLPWQGLQWHNKAQPATLPTRPELVAKGKSVLITGGGVGAGASRIAILGRRLQPLIDNNTFIEKHYPGVEVFAIPADVTKKADVGAAFAQFCSDGHKVDTLVSSAATIGPKDPVALVDGAPYLDFSRRHGCAVARAVTKAAAFRLWDALMLSNPAVRVVHVHPGSCSPS
ncbi:hypothetical protein HK405_014791 [Cladochytrium tenue]|nr:hypothetical protein HK405_014791 [Cladochytrium tenue]